MLSRSLCLLGAAASLAAVGATSAAAAPRTAIAYVDGADVSLVDPDGTGAHALTADGTADDRYRRPRVAADGSVWALRSWDLVHVAGDGRRLGTIHVTPPKDAQGRDLQYVPEWLDLSPDGRRAVWSVTNWNCSPEPDVPCSSDAISGVVDLAGGQQVGLVRGLTETSFLDDEHLVGVDERGLGDVRVATLTGAPALWYNDRDAFTTEIGTPEQPAVNAQQTRYATLRLVQGVGIGVFLYKIATLTSPPQKLCVINNVDVTGAGPSWSPDGRSVVVAQKDGLAAYDLGGLEPGGDCSKVGFTSVSGAGAIEPDWGVVPGTVPDGRSGTPGPGAAPAPGAGAGATPRPAVVTPPGGGAVSRTPVAPAPELAVGLGQRLSGILRSGLKVRLSGWPSGKAKVVVKSGARTVGGRTVTVAADGRASATIALTAAGRKALRRARSATLTVTVGGVRVTVKVKR